MSFSPRTVRFMSWVNPFGNLHKQGKDDYNNYSHTDFKD
jgi:hypothetical protein